MDDCADILAEHHGDVTRAAADLRSLVPSLRLVEQPRAPSTTVDEATAWIRAFVTAAEQAGARRHRLVRTWAAGTRGLQPPAVSALRSLLSVDPRAGSGPVAAPASTNDTVAAAAPLGDLPPTAGATGMAPSAAQRGAGRADAPPRGVTVHRARCGELRGLELAPTVRSLTVEALERLLGQAVDERTLPAYCRRPGYVSGYNYLRAHISNWSVALVRGGAPLREALAVARAAKRLRPQTPAPPRPVPSATLRLVGRDGAAVEVAFWTDDDAAHAWLQLALLDAVYLADPSLDVWRFGLLALPLPGVMDTEAGARWLVPVLGLGEALGVRMVREPAVWLALFAKDAGRDARRPLEDQVMMGELLDDWRVVSTVHDGLHAYVLLYSYVTGPLVCRRPTELWSWSEAGEAVDPHCGVPLLGPEGPCNLPRSAETVLTLVWQACARLEQQWLPQRNLTRQHDGTAADLCHRGEIMAQRAAVQARLDAWHARDWTADQRLALWLEVPRCPPARRLGQGGQRPPRVQADHRRMRSLLRDLIALRHGTWQRGNPEPTAGNGPVAGLVAHAQ